MLNSFDLKYICTFKLPVMPYSFTEITSLKIMELSHSLLPGIRKVVAIAYDPASSALTARVREPVRENLPAETLSLAEDMAARIETERAKASGPLWLHEEDLPFEDCSTQDVQMTVFHEMETRVLLLPVENDFDGKKDLLYFYFPDHYTHFFLGKPAKGLLPDHKAILGTTLHHAVLTISSMNREDRKVLRQINGNTRSIIEKYKETREEVKKLTQGAQRNISDICKHLLDEISSGNGLHYELSQAAAEKLKGFRGDIPTLKAILRQAADFASALDFGNLKDEIRIDDFHLHLELTPTDEQRRESQSEMTSNRYSRTISLLDKLEKASRSVLARDLPLTGSNVGNACQKAISAPAITDALRKHRNKIISLLGLYPDRWSLIRSEFKPLINILSPRLSEEQKENKIAG